MSEHTDGLRLTEVSKRFGATRALVSAELRLPEGEIHTLLGENGSGKSTLVKIIGGVHRPDEGGFTLNGEPLSFRSPRDAAANGITVVFQEVLTAPSQSVLENIWLGADGVFARRLSRQEQRRIAAEELEGSSTASISIHLPAVFRSQSVRPSALLAPSCASPGSWYSTSRPQRSTCSPGTACSPRCGDSPPRA